MENYEVLAELFGTTVERVHLWSDDSLTIGDCDTIDYYIVERGDVVDGYSRVCSYKASDGITYELYKNSMA